MNFNIFFPRICVYYSNFDLQKVVIHCYDMNITIRETKEIKKKDILSLYEANQWSSAQKPDALYNALMNSDTLVSAWDGNTLVGIGNAITDGHLVVYYPHLLVLPEYQGHGVGKKLMEVFQERYAGFHQQILVADGRAIDFYERCGFKPAGETRAMWIYNGQEHEAIKTGQD